MTLRKAIPGFFRLWPATLFCLWLPLTLTSALAQGDPFNGMGSTITGTKAYYSNGGTPLELKVVTGKEKRLDRQAMIKLTNQSTHNVTWQTTDENSEAVFVGLQFGHYEIEVSAVGYLTTHKDLELLTQNSTYHEIIALEPDPEAIDLKLSDGTMPAKARKDSKRGLNALKSGNLNSAQKWLDSAYKAYPSSSDLNFLLGYMYYQKKDYSNAATFLGNATTMNPHDVVAMTLLGRLALQQEDYPTATSHLQKAVETNSDYWMAHHFLADSYLQQHQYEKAQEQALLSIGDGQVKANPSQLVLGQALVNMGKQQEGIKALKTFLQESPKNPVSPQVRDLISQLETRGSSAAPAAKEEPKLVASLAGINPLAASPEPSFSVQPWHPPGIDESKPLVAADAPCPYDTVIQTSGIRVKELVDDVSRISAIEHLLHEQLDEMGNPLTKDTRQFNYVASITETTPGFLSVDEYRQENLGISDFPDQIASSGFASLALVFHPSMRDNFEMVCEGLGQLRGRATWLVHFRQRDDRPARMHDYKVGSQTYALKLKGRAWISADRFQIVRIEAELTNPMPQIRLNGEQQIVEYAPVPFAKRNLQLWLPQSAELYLDFRKHRYYRKHSFDHYMLFSVDADEKRKEPVAPPAPATNTTPQPN
jgi:tetratricopeptide (TPR) repeat protein